MENKILIKALFGAKIRISEQLIERLPDGLGANLKKVRNDVLEAINEVSGDYLNNKEEPSKNDNDLKKVHVD